MATNWYVNDIYCWKKHGCDPQIASTVNSLFISGSTYVDNMMVYDLNLAKFRYVT